MVPIAKDKFPQFTQEMWSPNTVYLLGLLWADGNIYSGGRSYRINLEILKDDADEIEETVLSTGPWRTYLRKRGEWRPQYSFHTNDRFFYQYLYELDYGQKSIKSADAVLAKIPAHLQYLWWRGFWDGDGNFYYHSGQYLYQTTLTGTCEQNWGFVENLYDGLDIQFSKQRVDGSSSCSRIRTSGKNNFLKVGEFLYQDLPNIGLSRKKEIFSRVATLTRQS